VNDEIELRRALDALSKALPEGAPIVVVPTNRARDRIEVVPGMVVPFGLVSSSLCSPHFGGAAIHATPDVRIFEGVVGARHAEQVVPLIESAAAEHRALVLVADDFDEAMITVMIMSSQRGMPAYGLVPQPAAGELPLHAFAALTVATLGAANEAGLEVAAAGRPPRLFSTVHETIVTGPLPLLDANARSGVLHVGGEDSAEARGRARIARALLTRALN
jgi:hypothetical protein